MVTITNVHVSFFSRQILKDEDATATVVRTKSAPSAPPHPANGILTYICCTGTISVLCNLPLTVWVVCLFGGVPEGHFVFEATSSSIMLNSLVNPLLYCFCFQNMRQKITRQLCCRSL